MIRAIKLLVLPMQVLASVQGCSFHSSRSGDGGVDSPQSSDCISIVGRWRAQYLMAGARGLPAFLAARNGQAALRFVVPLSLCTGDRKHTAKRQGRGLAQSRRVAGTFLLGFDRIAGMGD
jgi:hypothetical protein